MTEVELDILARLDRIEAKIDRLISGRQRLSHQDHLLLARLAPALRGRYGSSAFTTSEITTDPVFSALLDNASTQELGNLLARAVDQDLDGVRIIHAGRDHNSTIWSLELTRTSPVPIVEPVAVRFNGRGVNK